MNIIYRVSLTMGYTRMNFDFESPAKATAFASEALMHSVKMDSNLEVLMEIKIVDSQIEEDE